MKATASNRYGRFCQEANALAECVEREDRSTLVLADYAGGISQRYDLALGLAALDTMSVGLVESADPETGGRIVTVDSDFPPNRAREEAFRHLGSLILYCAALHERLRPPSPAHLALRSRMKNPPPLPAPPDFGELATEIRAASDALAIATVDVTEEHSVVADPYSLTVKQAAKLLRISEGQVSKLANAKKLLARGEKTSRRIHIGSACEWFKQRLQQPERVESYKRVQQLVDREASARTMPKPRHI